MIIICLKIVLTETCLDRPTPVDHPHILTPWGPFESLVYDRKACGAYQKCTALSASWWEGWVYWLTSLTGPKLHKWAKTIIPGVKKLIECLNHESSTGTPGYQLLILINQCCTLRTLPSMTHQSKVAVFSEYPQIHTQCWQISTCNHHEDRLYVWELSFSQVSLFRQVIKDFFKVTT